MSTHCLIALILIRVVANASEVDSVTSGESLVSHPRLLGVVNFLSSPPVVNGRLGPYPGAVDLVKSKSVSVLPDWRSDHPAVAEDTRHAGQKENQEHLAICCGLLS